MGFAPSPPSAAAAEEAPWLPPLPPDAMTPARRATRRGAALPAGRGGARARTDGARRLETGGTTWAFWPPQRAPDPVMAGQAPPPKMGRELQSAIADDAVAKARLPARWSGRKAADCVLRRRATTPSCARWRSASTTRRSKTWRVALASARRRCASLRPLPPLAGVGGAPAAAAGAQHARRRCVVDRSAGCRVARQLTRRARRAARSGVGLRR